MAEAEGGGTLQTGHFSMQMSNLQRDLLQRFIPGGNHFRRKFEELTKETEEIELSLGLSLNGRFGVDPQANKLARSSSIPDFMNPARRNDETASVVPPMIYTPLSRTCSLPVETAEEWRKRKELQSLRRMEAKRKRTEKQRNLRAARDRNRCDLEENCEEDKRVKDIGSLPINGDEQYKPSETLNLGAPSSWVGGGRGGGGFNGGGIESRSEKGNGLVGGGLEGLLPPPPPPSQLSQGSIGSQGSGGSSGVSEFENQPVQGVKKCTEASSPASMQSLSDQIEQKSTVNPGTTGEKSGKSSGVANENPSDKLTVADKESKEVMRNVMVDMPCVSTKGDGPNGKRIEGFLYRYRKGEEVRIVCVCHGSFLSPAEFVKHAGGGDVEQPLKRIVVSPSSLL